MENLKIFLKTHRFLNTGCYEFLVFSRFNDQKETETYF